MRHARLSLRDPRTFGSLILALAATVGLAPQSAGQTSCGDWTQIPVPDDPSWWSSWFEDVTVAGPDDAWAVGFYSVPKPGSGFETFTLAMHWDGVAWTKVPTPSPAPYPGGTKAYLNGVDAVSPNDVWAGGDRYGDAGGLSVGQWVMVQHWDGSSWKEIPVPTPPGGVSINFSGTRVHTVRAVGKDDVWFGGQWGEPNALGSVTWRPLQMHWDGSGLTVYPTPTITDGYYAFHTVSMSAVSSSDIWAVCQKNTAGGYSKKNVILHWDGSSWSLAPVPDASAEHTLYEIVANSANDVWVFGEAPWTYAPYVLHYDGNSWKEVANAPSGTAAGALGAGEIYVGRSDITLFDGSSSNLVEPFAGVTQLQLYAMAPAGSCDMWTVGRHATSNGMRPFAARLQNATWTDLGHSLAGVSGSPKLVGSGTLAAGSPVQLSLTGAAPVAPSALIVGTSQIDSLFQGGILVPSPNIVLTGLVTGAGGNISIGTSWPIGIPSGVSFYFQSWIVDSGGPIGFAASNGLRAQTP